MKASYKSIITILVVSLILTFSGQATNAQPSLYFSYQAVVTDNEGNPLDGILALRISIIQYSEDGESVYMERHTQEADENGFLSLRIGEGENIYKGEFDTINWSDGPYYLKIDIDPSGGFSYPISTTQELLSVPFAMHALTADSLAFDFQESDPVFMNSVAYGITEEDTARWNSLSKVNKYKVGDLAQGGIIFYVSPEGDRGLAALPYDLEMSQTWGATGQISGALSSFDGRSNTDAIVTQSGEGDYAAWSCDTLIAEGYDDWYLPSVDELNLLFRNRYIVNKSLEEDENPGTIPVNIDTYWTSTEKNADESYMIKSGTIEIQMKDIPAKLRPVRAF